MKDELRKIARKNGNLARVKAGRLAVILRMYHANPKGGQWLRAEAAHLAKSVSFHLRQATVIGQLIASFEEKPDKSNSLTPGRTTKHHANPLREGEEKRKPCLR